MERVGAFDAGRWKGKWEEGSSSFFELACFPPSVSQCSQRARTAIAKTQEKMKRRIEKRGVEKRGVEKRTKKKERARGLLEGDRRERRLEPKTRKEKEKNRSRKKERVVAKWRTWS